MQRYLTAFVPFVPVLNAYRPGRAPRSDVYSFLLSFLSSIYICRNGTVGTAGYKPHYCNSLPCPTTMGRTGATGTCRFLFLSLQEQGHERGAISMLHVGYRRTRGHGKVKGSG